jgi:AraC-like DNA-binding protein
MLLKGIRETDIFDGGFPVKVFVNKHEEYSDYPSHWHHAIELCYVLEGSYSVETNGKLHHLEESDILFIAGGDIHRLPCQKQAGKRLFLQFMLEGLENLYELKDIMPLLSRTFLLSASWDKDFHNVISTYLNQLKQTYENREFACNIRIYALILNIIADISHHLYYKPADIYAVSSKSTSRLSRIGQLFQYIDEHYHEDICLDNAAKATGFSRYYLTRYLKDAMGKSFLQFLHEYRVKKTEKLLLTGEMPMIEIASSCGFGSISTFNRVFKKYKGCSPLEYILRMRINKQGSGV